MGDSKRRKTGDQAVENFREYLRIKSVQPDPDYDSAIVFLTKQAKELGLPYSVTEVHPGRPVFVMTWEGTQPKLPSIMLNSHIDVVPVDREHWTYDPFEAVKTENGNIYARGSQDMKCVGIQYIEAVRRLKSEGQRLKRTLHLTFVPEEEIGGKLGMLLYLNTDSFKSLNLGLALDEGLANPTDAFKVYYGQRSEWWIMFRMTGNPGHGSRFIENTGVEKLRIVMNKALDYRAKQVELLNSSPDLTPSDVTSLNVTMMKGSGQMNVIPSELTLGVDMRLAVTENFDEMRAMLDSWVTAAGEGVSYSFLNKLDKPNITPIGDDNLWWKAFMGACNEMKLKIEPEIFPAGTDSRFLRELGYPAFGFSPMNNTPVLLHDHDEFLNEDIFLRGIDIYHKLIPSLANLGAM